jgi:hypothetical protein
LALRQIEEVVVMDIEVLEALSRQDKEFLMAHRDQVPLREMEVMSNLKTRLFRVVDKVVRPLEAERP